MGVKYPTMSKVKKTSVYFYQDDMEAIKTIRETYGLSSDVEAVRFALRQMLKLIVARDLNAASNLAALTEPVRRGELPGELDGLPSTTNQEGGILR